MAQRTTRTERDLLRSYLDDQRAHVLGILEGLDEDALRRPVPLPSGWSPLGLLQHLTLDVELFWFRAVIAGDQAAIAEMATIANAWQVAPDAPADAILARYREECARADAIIAATPLDAAPAWWPEGLFGDWRVDSVRQVILHVMTETAIHAGHLDAVRELTDGRQWLVLTE